MVGQTHHTWRIDRAVYGQDSVAPASTQTFPPALLHLAADAPDRTTFLAQIPDSPVFPMGTRVFLRSYCLQGVKPSLPFAVVRFDTIDTQLKTNVPGVAPGFPLIAGGLVNPRHAETYASAARAVGRLTTTSLRNVAVTVVGPDGSSPAWSDPAIAGLPSSLTMLLEFEAPPPP